METLNSCSCVSQLTSFFEVKEGRNLLIAKAISLILALGGLFLLLAAYEGLPYGPNAVSHLGDVGKTLGFIMIGVGGIAFMAVYQISKMQGVDSDSTTSSSRPPLVNYSSRSSTTHSYANLVNTISIGSERLAKAKADERNAKNNYYKIKAEGEATLNKEKEKTKAAEVNLELTIINSQLSSISYGLSPNYLDAQESSQEAMNKFHENFQSYKKLFESGNDLVSKINGFRDEIKNQDKIQKTIVQFNQILDKIKKELAQIFAKEYPTLDALPEEFKNPTCEAYKGIRQCWDSMVSSN